MCECATRAVMHEVEREKGEGIRERARERARAREAERERQIDGGRSPPSGDREKTTIVLVSLESLLQLLPLVMELNSRNDVSVTDVTTFSN